MSNVAFGVFCRKHFASRDMYSLEKYKGLSSRHTCPNCGKSKVFVRYVDELGRYLSPLVGRCNRESKCGYHFKPKQFLKKNPTAIGEKNASTNPVRGKLRPVAVMHDCIEKHYLIDSLRNYERNAFVQFLHTLFPNNHCDVWRAVNDYLIGTTENGKTIFWQVDAKREIRTGKIIEYDSVTGKRVKHASPNWVHAVLKKSGRLKSDFELKQCFFGEHLLRLSPFRPIAIVEAEKSAIIASICKSTFPDFVWLACGGKSNLNTARLARLGSSRQIILYPDADGYTRWEKIASDARSTGLSVKVSTLIKKLATDAEKDNGNDIADYLISQQLKTNSLASVFF